MRRHSVVLKLFVVTAALILIVFSLVMLAEGLFFERFYRTSKIHDIDRNMNQFVKQFKQEEFNQKHLSRLLGTFMNQNDASTSILNNRFERTNINPYYLELRVDSKIITILIPLDGMPMDKIPLDIHIGDMLVVDGIFMDEKDTIMHPLIIQPNNDELEKGLVRVKGKITDLMLPEQRSYNPLYQNILIDDALRDLRSQVEQYQSRLKNGSTVKVEWTDKWSGIQYAILLHSLSEGKNGDRYLFAMTSLQPVGEAVEILKQYFVYTAPIIIVLVIILSLIYSRMVSRPLVLLSRSASRLANLDFTIQPEIQSKDEFGELSRNMIKLSHNLDAALRELTHANVKLQEDMKEKQRSEQLRKELIANISHELKTPLGIVKGFAEGLQDEVASDKKDRYLTLIVNETDRMNALIMDMLELSKFEVKAIRLQPTILSLASLIQSVIDSFSQQLESKNLQIRLNKGEENDLLVRADSRRIEQVAVNLLSNAIRHAEVNSTLTIDIKRTAVGKVTTVIENRGEPIAAEDVSRIWDHFYRAERSRDRKSGGTGLGLAIVKHIMELHEGEFGVENTEHGVAFYFTLNESRGETHE
ncbi:sensor histidine kinase [Cohnella abietis]|uniref:histidine kinase n=1 Tax=Cohnella abietis TaxID=2507935 RepID=A0A3T1DE85_9BACL|nr:HAMP domain-containing sensor histidine kinase [Cohnella abietis]BBI36476.1 hypothetical protein KCTCHS21_58750 [Cohnella abietis]